MQKSQSLEPEGTGAADPPGAAYRIVRWYLGPLLALLLVAILAFTWAQFCFLAGCRLDISYPEGAVAARALDVAKGVSPYHDWREWPHAFAPYGPLAYYPAGWTLRWSGLPVGIRQAYVTGRCISLLSILIVCGILYALARRTELSRTWSFLMICSVFVWQELLIYCASLRPDAPKALCALGALALMAGRAPRPWRVLASGGLLGLSFWIKPTNWGIALAWAIWAGGEGGVRRSLVALLGFGLAGLIPAWWMDHRLQGRLFLNMVGSLDNGWSLKPFWMVLTYLLQWQGPVLAAPCWLALRELRLRKTGEAGRLLAWAFLLTLFFALVQYLKAGSDLNYFLESYLLGSILATGGISRLWDRVVAGGARRWEKRLLALVAAFVILHTGIELVDFRESLKMARRSRQTHGVPQLLSGSKGPVLSTYPFVALSVPENSVILDHYQYAVLAGRGRLKTKPLLDRVRAKAFSAIVLTDEDGKTREVLDQWRNLYCPEFLPTLLENYRMECQVSYFYILTPRRP